MNDEDEQVPTSNPEESGPLIPPLLKTEEIYMVERSGEAILWRATIGGVAGYGLLVSVLLAASSNSLMLLFLINPPMLFFAGAVGMIIGGVLRLYYRKYRRNPGMIMRVLVGISLATGITWIMVYMISYDRSRGSAEIKTFAASLILSLAVGGLSGLMARPKKNTKMRNPAS
jgi:hypothetical protein